MYTLLRYMYMYLLFQGVYTLQISHTASLVGENHCHECITDVHHYSGLTNSEKTMIFTNMLYASKALLLFDFFFLSGVYNLQILHTTSLVGQD